jgi:DNA-binding MarR family transcriptional regulator
MNTGHVISLVSKIREKANKLIVAELKKHGIEGIAPSHGSIFAMLYKNGPSSMTQIADCIHKDKSTVTALIDKLENLGYAKRCEHETCQRTTMIELTEKGRILESAFVEISDTLLKIVYRDFSEDEKEALIKLLEKINSNL